MKNYVEEELKILCERRLESMNVRTVLTYGTYEQYVRNVCMYVCTSTSHYDNTMSHRRMQSQDEIIVSYHGHRDRRRPHPVLLTNHLLLSYV